MADTTLPNSPHTTDTTGPRPGDRLGHYRIVRCLGIGGMGAVFEALQDQPRRAVAIKVMKPAATAQARRRFRAEAESLGRLNHPAIARVYEAGNAMLETPSDAHHAPGAPSSRAEPLAFIAMELVPGATTITRFAALRTLSLVERLALVLPIVDALAHSHERGITHRDLKPGNILVDADGRARLIDFGIARQTGALAAAATSTQAGQLIGTLAYMSPEQAAAEPGTLDWRTDIYSIGVVLHEVLTGTLPYTISTGDPLEVARVISERPAALANRLDEPGEPLPEPLCRVLLTCLAKDRNQRYATARALGADLRAVIGGQPVSATRHSPGALLRAQARFHTARQPVVACLLILAVATGLGLSVGSPLASPAALLTQWVRQKAASLDTSVPAFDHVRIIAITDETDAAELARSEFLAPIDATRPTALRPLHALLLDRLAQADARVIAFDITFNAPSEYDALLVRRADPAPGTGLVFAAAPWSAVANILPASSARPRALLGGITVNARPDHLLDVELALLKPRGSDTAALLSLALSALAQWHAPQPPSGFPLVRIANNDRLILTPAPGLPPLLIETAGVLTESAETASPQRGILAGDSLAYFPAEVPPEPIIAAATIPFHRVLKADTATLRQWFAGRAVVVGDHRTGVDLLPYTDSRRVPGSVAHAAAIESLLRCFAFTRSWLFEALACAGCAIVGVCAAALTRRRARRLAALGLAAALTIGTPAAALLFAGTLVNAASLAIGMLCATGLVAWCGLGPRERHRPSSFLPPQESPS